MRGFDGVARVTAAAISARIVDRLAILAGEQGPVPPNGADPTPRLVHWTQLDPMNVGLDSWPFVMVVPVRTVEMRYADRRPDGVRTFDIRYLLRVYAYVRGEGYDEVAGVRGRLAVGLREVLFDAPKLADGVVVETAAGVSEEFSDITPVDTLGSVAAVALAVTVRSNEAATPSDPPYGVVDETQVTVTRWPAGT